VNGWPLSLLKLPRRASNISGHGPDQRSYAWDTATTARAIRRQLLARRSGFSVRTRLRVWGLNWVQRPKSVDGLVEKDL